MFMKGRMYGKTPYEQEDWVVEVIKALNSMWCQVLQWALNELRLTANDRVQGKLYTSSQLIFLDLFRREAAANQLKMKR